MRTRAGVGIALDLQCYRRLRGKKVLDLERASPNGEGALALSTRQALSLALADAISSFSSVILWSALPPHFSLHDVPTTYGLNVFILLDDTSTSQAM